MEGWHSTGTALFPLLKRIACPDAKVTSKISNLQYPSRWRVHLESNTYSLHGVQPLRSIDVSRGVNNEHLPKHPILSSGDDRARSKLIIQRLKAIDLRTSRYFKLKEQVQNNFRMRLLKVGDSDIKTDIDGLDTTTQSSEDKASGETSHEYIALSYCWHYDDWTPNPDLGGRASSSDSGSFLPITIPMWKAFLAERESPSEAVWVDQRCIRQANLAEKTYAINSMDVVFGAARKVVIVLEDVELGLEDADALMKYCHALQSIPRRERSLIWADWLQFVDDKEELALACLKIFRARWFRRAWCSHEFLTAKSHTFLIPVLSSTLRSNDLHEHVQILNFDGEFLLALLLARTDWIVSQDRNELAGTIRHHESILSNAKLGSKVAIDRFLKQDIIMVGFTQGLVEAILKARSAESMKPFLAALGDILSLESSSAVDKLVITLNVLKTGLSYQGPLDQNDTDVSMMITMIALAAGDASALASSGAFLAVEGRYPFTNTNLKSPPEETLPNGSNTINGNGSRIGWATRPQVDTYSRLGLQRVESPVTACMTPEGLQLDLIFVATSRAIRAPNSRFLESARTLLSLHSEHDDQVSLDTSSADEDAVLAEFRAFSLERDHVQQTLTGINRPQFVQALACLLELGCWWVAGYGMNLRSNYLDVDPGEHNYQMGKVQQALIWAQSLPSCPTLFKSQEHDTSKDYNTHLKILVQYASQIVKTGAGERSEFVKGQVNTDYAFHICEIQDIAADVSFNAETLVYAPLSSSSSYQLAIPAPLAASGFPIDMNRVWILEKKKSGNESGGVSHRTGVPAYEHCVLRGKTRFVGCTVPHGDTRTVIVSG